MNFFFLNEKKKKKKKEETLPPSIANEEFLINIISAIIG